MSTPFDGKILMVNYTARTTPGGTIEDTARLFRDKLPNVSGIILKSSNGRSWQGHLGNDQSDPKAITGITKLAEWVTTFSDRGLDVHAWGVPRAKTVSGESIAQALEKEADIMIKAANVGGIKSILLDVEMGQGYWQGGPAEARQFMRQLRAGIPAETHIALVLDGRLNRDFSVWIDPWLDGIGSLHPMIYPVLFGRYQSIAAHVGESFRNLERYNLPIVPMLQLAAEGGRPSPADIIEQGSVAWAQGAAGLSFFRLGSDHWSGDSQPHSGEREYAALSQIAVMAAPPVVEAPEVLPYTWQDVINAAVTVAARRGGNWNEWLSAAGFWRGWHDSLRQQPYSGPDIRRWSLAQEDILALLELLDLDSAELVRVTIDAQNRHELRLRDETAARRRDNSLVGVHGAPGTAAPSRGTWDRWIELLKEMGINWYKQVDNGDPNDLGPNTMFAWAKRLKAEGIEPIIRFMMPEQFPEPLPGAYFQKMRRYAEAGITYAEIGNEPNLEIEWKSQWRSRGDHRPVHQANPEAIRLIAEIWIRDATKTLEAGLKPAFYAFAPTDWKGNFHPQYSSVWFTRKVIRYLADHHRADTIDIFNRGGWIAVHAASYEQDLDFDPFGQAGAVWDMTLRGYEVPLRAFQEHFGDDLNVEDIVVMSTEGGVFTPNSTSMAGHVRLQTDEEHGRRMVEMFRYLERQSPLQAMCPWCLSVGDQIGHFDERFRFDSWIEDINGQLQPRAVYEALRQLRFDHEREEESLAASTSMFKLVLPYISQFDASASSHNADCGPACLAMILNAGKDTAAQITVDQIYDRYLSAKAVGEFTLVDELVDIGNSEGLPTHRVEFADSQEALTGLRDLVRRLQPFIALVNYAAWDDVAKNNFLGAHFVVVSGFDDGHVFVHDPLFRGNRRQEGEYFVWRNDKFLDGWGSGDLIGNPDFVAVVHAKTVGRL